MVVFEEQVMTVGQLNLFIKDIFGQIPILNNIKIKGEISNFKHHSSGHMYMSLKDDTGVIRAVMFKNSAMSLKFRPENGMQVIAAGRVSVYERDGQYQLYINEMEQDGKGNLYEQFEKLKKQLEKEGLFDSAKKKLVPQYPKKIGVITAATGAAVRDIINILSRRYKAADVCLYPVLVQGDGAAESIKTAIEYFNESSSCDVIIVGRGGGSVEDLWAFNEEVVARAIFASRIPIISAVGHETDFTIADFVADLRAPTPSAAAELAVPDGSELLEKLQAMDLRLLSGAKKLLENRRLVLKVYSDKQVLKNPTIKINEKAIYLDHLSKMFENSINLILEKKKQELGIIASRMEGLSPLKTLARGYSVVKNNEGKIVKAVSQVNPGENLMITVQDGEICTIVK
ncbi:MAG: exodeoxyribonuclease VII large subunit [Clostridia bacterium]|nr:exodeoxyribonuclease VII large subunit [Clostridia bacterium]